MKIQDHQRRATRICFALILTYLVTSNTTLAQVPTSFNYQGVLHQNSEAVDDGIYEVLFSLYDMATEGNMLWAETQQVEVLNGVFNTRIGKNNPLEFEFNSSVWLGLTINNEELSPRVFLASVPFALMAKSVEDESITTEKIADDQVVKAVNGLKDDVTLIGGDNISIETQGDNITIHATSVPGDGTIPAIIPEENLINPVGYGTEIITIDPSYIFNSEGDQLPYFRIPDGKTIRIMKDYPDVYIRYIQPEGSDPLDPEDCPYPATENCNTYIPVAKDLLITDRFYDPRYVTERDINGETRISRDEQGAPYTTIAFYIKTNTGEGEVLYQSCGAGNGDCGLKIYAAIANTTIEPFMFFNYWEDDPIFFAESDPDGFEVSEYTVPQGKKLVATLIIIKGASGRFDNQILSSIAYDGKIMTTEDFENDVVPIPFIFEENTLMTFSGEVKLVGYFK